MEGTVSIIDQPVIRSEQYVLLALTSFPGYAKLAMICQRLVVPMERQACHDRLTTLKKKGLVRSRTSGTRVQEWSATSYARDYFLAHPFTPTEDEQTLIRTLLTSPYRLSVNDMVVDGAYTQLLIALAQDDNWVPASRLAVRTGYPPKSVAHRLTHLYEIDFVDGKQANGTPTLYALGRSVREHFREHPHYLNLSFLSKGGA